MGFVEFILYPCICCPFLLLVQRPPKQDRRPGIEVLPQAGILDQGGGCTCLHDIQCPYLERRFALSTTPEGTNIYHDPEGSGHSF